MLIDFTTIEKCNAISAGNAYAFLNDIVTLVRNFHTSLVKLLLNLDSKH